MLEGGKGRGQPDVSRETIEAAAPSFVQCLATCGSRETIGGDGADVSRETLKKACFFDLRGDWGGRGCPSNVWRETSGES
ncbi:MAG: hypothetical protein MPL62_02345 [Alphaproteobacteria bacterium]|nr:hypothetical protein [Alphaproteobacteria bacterium]